MNNEIVLRFVFSNNDVDDKLLPWKKYCTEPDNTINETYQIGIGINYKKKYIITPFSIYMPYAQCFISDSNIKLKLDKYCIYTRLAYYIYDNDKNDHQINYYNIAKNNLDLSELHNLYINTFITKINVIDSKIIFKNINNILMNPFIWISLQISSSYNNYGNVYDSIIPGTPVMKDNNIKGIVYNVDKNNILVIPIINIIMNNCDKLSNILIKYNIIKSKTIITNLRSNNTYKQLIVHSINNKKIENGNVFFKNIKIYVPLNCYVWYSKRHIELKYIKFFNFNVPNTYNILYITKKNIFNMISIPSYTSTNFIIKNNIIFGELNLLLFEWLQYNNIIIKNKTYIEHIKDPFKKNKNIYVLIGLINKTQHPLHIHTFFDIYNKINECNMFSIIKINNQTKYSNNIFDNKNMSIILNDNYDSEIELDWSL